MGKLGFTMRIGISSFCDWVEVARLKSGYRADRLNRRSSWLVIEDFVESVFVCEGDERSRISIVRG